MRVFEPYKDHQRHQLAVINQIEASLKSSQLPFSTIEPVTDFAQDTRLALTSVHFLNPSFIDLIINQLQTPLRDLQPNSFWYGPERLHFTIKNVRTVADPPDFNDYDAELVRKQFEKALPQFSAFQAYYYRLMLFPQSLALIGTTDAEFDALVLSLDEALNGVGVPDNKVYVNQRYFFSNITLARFSGSARPEFIKAVEEVSAALPTTPYLVNSVTLLSANAAMFKQKIYGRWQLK